MIVECQGEQSDGLRQLEVGRNLAPVEFTLERVEAGGEFHRRVPVVFKNGEDFRAGFYVPGPVFLITGRGNPSVGIDSDTEGEAASGGLDLEREPGRPKTEVGI